MIPKLKKGSKGRHKWNIIQSQKMYAVLITCYKLNLENILLSETQKAIYSIILLTLCPERNYRNVHYRNV